ncbi:Asp-tRNA(Asn)/Glu-tRNA(Gln) amidotransferase subunit GatC [Hydrogenobaculum acidophilum]
MSISKEEVVKIAKLSRLELKEDEVEFFASQMKNILEFVNKLNEVSELLLEEEYKTSTPLREDEPEPSLDVEKVLLNAPSRRLNMFEVPKIVDAN